MDKGLIVVKVGTSSLTLENGDISVERIEKVVEKVARLKEASRDVILVSSGSIAAGFRRLGWAKRPCGIAEKQASAAVGQGLLMEEYTRMFMERGIISAQILLTRDDFRDHRRYKNAFRTLEVILKRGAIPIINENDTVSIDELRLGDNDMLSAQVAAMMHASMLVMLTDMDGLYTSDPRENKDAVRIERVEKITPEIMQLGGGAGTNNGTGGMATKLRAARLATSAGVPVVVCSSADDTALDRLESGGSAGTYFAASETEMRTRLQWMAFYAEPAGNIYIDEGAAEALLSGKSLLPPGISAAEGDFRDGDIVRVYLRGSNSMLGRGRINMNRSELKELMGIRRCDARGVTAINHENFVEER